MLPNGEKLKTNKKKRQTIYFFRTWKEYLSYKKEYDNEKRKVEKMANEGRDEHDVKKAVNLRIIFFH